MTTDARAPLHVTAEPGTPFIVMERTFAAPRELVFRCWSEPDLLKQWLGPKRLTMRVDQFDFRHGGAYRYVHVEPDGTEYGFRGVFHGPLTPDGMLQTFEFEGAPGHVSMDRLVLTDLGDGRTLARIESVFGSVAARDAMVESGMAGGVDEGFQQLDDLLVELGAGA